MRKPSRMEVRRPIMRDTPCPASGSMSTSTSASAPDPAAMRHAMAAYVRALHQAYLDASAPSHPAIAGASRCSPAGRITVVAIGTRYLHVVGTTDPLPAPGGQEWRSAMSCPGWSGGSGSSTR